MKDNKSILDKLDKLTLHIVNRKLVVEGSKELKINKWLKPITPIGQQDVERN